MVNKVILVGNVGKDPEVRHLESNVAVAKFPLATSETYRNKDGERITQTEWHNIVLWRGLAKVAEDYVKKGQALYIEGKIRSRKYEDKEGNTRYITEIVADNMQMLGRKGDSGEASTPSTPADTGKTSDSVEDLEAGGPDDDLPF
ncbi:MAG: single-stranded DNA-binding protein [Chlorobi bacterium]|nr:single-stranded DNA-binding protein [Chlorobiota bacterium]